MFPCFKSICCCKSMFDVFLVFLQLYSSILVIRYVCFLLLACGRNDTKQIFYRQISDTDTRTLIGTQSCAHSSCTLATVTYTHTRAHSHSHTHTHTVTRTLTQSRTPSHSHAHTHTVTHTQSCTHSHSHAHTHTVTPTLVQSRP